MPSSYSAATKGAMILNVPVIYIGGVLTGTSVSGTKVGLTEGGVDFDPGVTVRQVTGDGIRSPIAGLEYVIDYNAHFKFKIKEFSSANITVLEPGATSETAGSQTTYTPISCGTLYVAGDYLTDVMGVGTRGDGGLFVVHMPVGKVIKWKLDTKDKVEGMIDVDIQAYLDGTEAETSTDGAPYRIIDVTA
jgi:hypothetical protein